MNRFKEILWGTITLLLLAGCGRGTPHSNEENKAEDTIAESSNGLTIRDSADIEDEKIEVTEGLSNGLLPNYKAEVGKLYMDTVEFVYANYDYDYWFMDVTKGKDTIGFNIEEVYKFVKDDRLEVKWKLDSVAIPGDGETMHQVMMVLSANKIRK